MVTASSLSRVSLLIELSDHYPMVYDIIWALSFNSVIAEQLRQHQSFVNKLTHITDETMRQTIDGIRWNLDQDRSVDTSVSNTSIQQKKYDIFISYSHKDKQFCKQLYDDLKQHGYRIWIDFDSMHGNMMDAMAQAIEQSSIIIICMSESYRRSNFCRAEAQYAFQRQLFMVPILIQKHYKPDGWLAFIIGSLLYIDFTKYAHDDAIKMLTREMNLMINKDTASLNASSVNVDESALFTKLPLDTLILPENVQDWTEQHVQQWLVDNRLLQMARIVDGMNGTSLLRFHDYISRSDSQQIVTSLQRDSLRLAKENLSLTELVRFRDLIEQRILSQRTASTTNKIGTNNSTCCNIF
jgi:hypothetical protein